MALDGRDEDFGGDPQDMAEVYDEDNMSPDMDRIAGRDGLTFEEMPDVYDATRAVGDEDDDEALIGEELDDSQIVSLSLDEDQDDADPEDDDLRLRDQDAYADEDADPSDLADDDRDDLDGVEALDEDEVEQDDAGDLNNVKGARSAAQAFESSKVSDKNLAVLGYSEGIDEPTDPDSQAIKDAPLPHESHHPDREDERLDEGIEESFPASDPVSVKHIT